MIKPIITISILLFCAAGFSGCGSATASGAKLPNEMQAANTSQALADATPKKTKAPEEKEISSSEKADGVCDVYAYVIDKDPEGLNVRDAAVSGKVIGKIPQDADGTIVHLIATNTTGWVRIDHAENIEGKVVFDKKGWVSANMLGTSTRGYGTQGVELSESAPGSKVLTIIPPETEVKMFSCDKTNVRVKYKSFTGWLDQEQACPNPVTNCS
jgi:SH3-like domain-containing protein